MGMILKNEKEFLRRLRSLRRLPLITFIRRSLLLHQVSTALVITSTEPSPREIILNASKHRVMPTILTILNSIMSCMMMITIITMIFHIVLSTVTVITLIWMKMSSMDSVTLSMPSVILLFMINKLLLSRRKSTERKATYLVPPLLSCFLRSPQCNINPIHTFNTKSYHFNISIKFYISEKENGWQTFYRSCLV